MSTRQRRTPAERYKTGGIILAILVVIIAALAWLTQQHNSSSGQLQSTDQSTETAEARDEPVIHITDDITVKPIDDDYTKPESIWVYAGKKRPLADKEYYPSDLVQPNVAVRQDVSSEEQSIRKVIQPATEELFAAAKKEGISLLLGSGFRSANLQRITFEQYAARDGAAVAETYSSRPGHSEHQTGLAIDVSDTSRECYLEECFEDTKAGKWLFEHAHEYGFILRYPKNNTKTDFIYEPWHFRYVGKDLAAAIKQSGLTLDEVWPKLEPFSRKNPTAQ